MERTPTPQGEILLYENGGEKEFVSVVFQDETFWLTQSGIVFRYVKLYQQGRRNDGT